MTHQTIETDCPKPSACAAGCLWLALVPSFACGDETALQLGTDDESGSSSESAADGDAATTMSAEETTSGDVESSDGNSSAGSTGGDEGCGDGVLQPSSEECDDGNTEGADGCSPMCEPEVCGNGIVDPGEECEGDVISGHGHVTHCSAMCRLEVCGNGILDPDEECEGPVQGPHGSFIQCSPSCRLEVCGNGITDPGEECDDGNAEPDDNCNACDLGPLCGNEDLDPGEQCDLGADNGPLPAECSIACNEPHLVVELAAGYAHTCARLETGAVRCWGRGIGGQLGYGNTNDIGDDETPASAGDVSVGGTVAELAAGFAHTCARLSTGAVRCWGSGDDGQLGYGNTIGIGDDETPASAGDVPVN